MPRIRVEIDSAAAEQVLKSAGLRASFQRRGEAVADACNAQSSWGGYFTATTTDGDRVSTKVWSLSSKLPDEHDRHQRMVRNLDAGA